MMTARERWLAVLNREKPDRTPMDIWATEEAWEKLRIYLGLETHRQVCEQLHIDQPLCVGSGYVGPPNPNGEGDIYGIRQKVVEYEGGHYGEVTYNPLAQYSTVEQIEANYTWPNPDWWSYDHLPEAVAGGEQRPIRAGGSEPFLLYKMLRGQEQAFMDLVLNPEMVHYCLDKLFDLAYEDTRRTYEAIPGKVIITYIAEDMGAQDSLMFSPEQIREFLLPRMKRMIALAHDAGAYVFHHDDGACKRIIPEMIEIGIDVLNPVQWRCKGMDREGLKRDFGDKLVFHGSMDNQYTLEFGTVEEVKQEVLDNLRILGEGGGYIMAPCHNIQAVSPPENIVAMYETGYENG